jgi:Zn-dependent M28 family amino/carboxypeptidase
MRSLLCAVRRNDIRHTPRWGRRLSSISSTTLQPILKKSSSESLRFAQPVLPERPHCAKPVQWVDGPSEAEGLQPLGFMGNSSMTKCSLVIVLSTALGTLGAAEPATQPTCPTTIRVEHLRPHVEFLASDALRGRSGDDARLAADYLVARFQQMQLAPVFPQASYFQSIPGTPDTAGHRPEIGRNVGGWIEGRDPVLKDECIVIGVHYDHLGVRDGAVYHGADDNATGVAMMLEVARQIGLGDRPRRSVLFVGFDLEEQMLWGSRWFVAHPPRPLQQIKLFITADMIGRSLGDLPLPAVFVLGSEHAPLVKDTLVQVGRPEGLDVARLGIDLVGTRSDYGPFRDRKVPFLFFSTGEHPDYHTPDDTAARVDFEKAARVSSLVLQVVRHVANADAAPEWTDDVKTDLEEPRALHRITTLLLEAEKQRPLSDVQRYLVTTVQNRTQRILDQGDMSPDDRTWLVRMSQLLLLSVF